MAFYQRLLTETAAEREALTEAPVILRCFRGDITLDDYVAFLCQAWHHVRHTVPLLMATGARLPQDKEWLRIAVADYIEEELGHQEWILSDIEACGYDPETVRLSRPAPATELMVAYAWDMVQRVEPLGFFGMVHVLEGTSIRLADKAADAIGQTLKLPPEAFSYLLSHGSLDREHVLFFEGLMNRIQDEEERRLIVHAARMFYRLYGDVFRSLDPVHGLPRLQRRA